MDNNKLDMKKLLILPLLFLTLFVKGQFQKPSGVTSVPTYSFFKNRADSTVTIYMGAVDLYNTLLSKFDSVKVKGYATNYKLLSYKQIRDSVLASGYATNHKLIHMLDSLVKYRNDSTALSGYFTQYDSREFRKLNNHDSLSTLDEKSYNSLTDKPDLTVYRLLNNHDSLSTLQEKNYSSLDGKPDLTVYRLKSDTTANSGTATIYDLSQLGIIPNDTWQKSYDYAGNLINVWKVSKDNLLTFAPKVGIGSLYTVADAGKVTIASMPNLRAASGDTLQYNIELGKVSMLKMRGVADGSGGLSDTTVIIPKLRLTRNAVNGYYLKVVDSQGTIKPRPIEATYQGTWNATTNTPTLADGTGTASFFYRCVVAGTVNFGSGNITFSVGDDVYYSGTVWQRIPAVSYTLQPATKTVLGGVKLDSTSVKYNGSGQIYVKTDYVENATHTGDATGSTALTLATVNSNVGTYQGLTVNAKGLVTAAANQNYLANTLTNGNIFVGNASNVATGVTPSGNATISNTGLIKVKGTGEDVRNETGTTIASTMAVYISGFNNYPLITLASNLAELTHNVIGITVAPIAHQANGWIATTGQCDAETNGWTVGTELYLSAAGVLTSTAPTSGSVRHVAIVDVQANYPVGKISIYQYPEENYLAGGSGVDAILRTGDNAGANKFSFRNYANTEVASITSLGDYSGRKYTSTVATGTAPYSATSTTVNTNLNADLLDGYHSGTFKFANDTTASTGYLPIWRLQSGQGFNLLNDQWLTAKDYAGNVFNLIKVSKDNGVIIPNLQLNALRHVLNSGVTTISDMPLNTLATTGDYYGFKLNIGGVQALKIAGKWTGTAIDTIKVTAPVFEMTTGAAINKIAMSEDSRGKMKWSDTKYLFSLVANRILYASATNEMSQLPLGTSGQLMQSGGVNTPTWTTPTYPNSATSGKVLIGDGTNIVLSTPTFPNASATINKVIKSDGTNWVASTETYAIPSTSGNVMVSNGTNWTSSAKNLDWDKWAQWDGGSTGLTAATGRTSLGGTTIGQSIFTLGNPSAISFLRMNADNTATALSAADFRTAIGAGTSSTVGTVTSVGLSTPTGLTVTGSPITTSGTLALSLTSGYVIPTTTEQTNWGTAYTNRIATFTTTGTSGAATFSGNTLNIPQYQAAGSYLTSESDPVYSAWNKSTGISITKSQVSDFGTYQAPLVSGNNIRTVNGNTLLGSTDISTLQTTVSGNAGTATTLETARTINGVSFNGSANISVPSNIAPSTSGNVMTSNGTVWTSSAPSSGMTYPSAGKVGTSSSGSSWDNTVSTTTLMLNNQNNNTSTYTITSGNFILYSDLRLKRFIRPIYKPYFDQAEKIQFRAYSLKSDSTNQVRFGVIAQELERTLPELVNTDKNGMKSVNYIDLLILLVAQQKEAIKQLENRIEVLENLKK
jgi:hypothetical protein